MTMTMKKSTILGIVAALIFAASMATGFAANAQAMPMPLASQSEPQSQAQTALPADGVTLIVNGKTLTLSGIIQDRHFLVPLHAIAEAIGEPICTKNENAGEETVFVKVRDAIDRFGFPVDVVWDSDTQTMIMTTRR